MQLYDGVYTEKAFVYSYMFIDDFSFIQEPEVLCLPNLETTLEHVRSRFVQAGWEGDGNIGVLWLPPFVLTGTDDNYGVVVWHVKQRNDGISWLLSPIPLNLKPLLEQNETDWLLPISLVEGETERFVEKIDTELQILDNRLAFIRGMPESDDRLGLEHDHVVFRQGQMVMHYHDFLDDCFLNFVKEVIEGSTEITEIKLRGAIKLEISPSGIAVPNDNEDAAFLTRIQIIQSIWDWYRMAAFKDKSDMLYGSVRHQPDQDHKRTILRHVYLRNCIQHHGGQLTADVLSKLGVNRIEIATANRPIVLTAWNKIVLTQEEVHLLHTALKEISQSFERFVNTNIRARAYTKLSSPGESGTEAPETSKP